MASVATPSITDPERAAARAGVRAMLPLLGAIAPFGLVVGAAAGESGVPTLVGWSTSWAIYGGSAQLSALELLGSGAATSIVVATVLAVNARMAVMAAAVAPRWQGASRRWRVVAALLLVDPSYAVEVERSTRPGSDAERRAHYLGAAVTLWVGWLVLVATGIALGDRLPAGVGLVHAAPLSMLGLVAASARTRPAVVAGVVGGATALVTAGAPRGLGTLLAAGAGIAAGSTVGVDR